VRALGLAYVRFMAHGEGDLGETLANLAEAAGLAGKPSLEEALASFPDAPDVGEEMPPEIASASFDEEVESIMNPLHPDYPGNRRNVVTTTIDGERAFGVVQVVRPDGGIHYWNNGQFVDEARVSGPIYGVTIADDAQLRGYAPNPLDTEQAQRIG
jgi:hypothetical protein